MSIHNRVNEAHKFQIKNAFKENKYLPDTAEGMLDFLFQVNSDYCIYYYANPYEKTTLKQRLNRMWIMPLWLCVAPFKWLITGTMGLNAHTKLASGWRKLRGSNMKHKPLLGIDVDLTVCPSDEGWADWLYENSNVINFGFYKAEVEYNLSVYFDHPSPFEYWRTLDYSQFEPLVGSVDKLKELSQFFDIVFISVGKGTHGKSKYYWLKQHFPFMIGHMATKEKWLMNDSLVAIIDDRLENLEGFDPDKRVLFSTPYRQTIDIPVSSVLQDWDSVNTEEFCDKYLPR